MSHRHCSYLQEMSDIHSLPREKCHRRLQEARREANEEACQESTERRETKGIDEDNEDFGNIRALRLYFSLQRAATNGRRLERNIS